MSKTVRMDRFGRVVIPQGIRERCGLLGDSCCLEISETAEGILLRPRPEDIPAERHSTGWVVFRSSEGETIDPIRSVEEEREGRHQQVREGG